MRAAARILIVKRSHLQLFLSIRFGGATALTLTETIHWTPIKIRMESGGLHASMEGIIMVLLRSEAVALPNLRQTLRGRERSKRGRKGGVRSVRPTDRAH